jgi:hypothetical protein
VTTDNEIESRLSEAVRARIDNAIANHDFYNPRSDCVRGQSRSDLIRFGWMVRPLCSYMSKNQGLSDDKILDALKNGNIGEASSFFGYLLHWWTSRDLPESDFLFLLSNGYTEAVAIALGDPFWWPELYYDKQQARAWRVRHKPIVPKEVIRQLRKFPKQFLPECFRQWGFTDHDGGANSSSGFQGAPQLPTPSPRASARHQGGEK